MALAIQCLLVYTALAVARNALYALANGYSFLLYPMPATGCSHRPP